MTYENPMKKLEGKIVVRTHAKQLNPPLSGISSMFQAQSYDRSYMSSPIQIVRARGTHCYYFDRPNGDLRLMSADYCDHAWEEVDPEFAQVHWFDKLIKSAETNEAEGQEAMKTNKEKK